MKNNIIHVTLILFLGVSSCSEPTDPVENQETKPYLESFKKVNDSTDIKMGFKKDL